MSIISINRRELSHQQSFIDQIYGYSIEHPPTICYDPSILYCPPAHVQEVRYASH
jgi:hypothetical protein